MYPNVNQSFLISYHRHFLIKIRIYIQGRVHSLSFQACSASDLKSYRLCLPGVGGLAWLIGSRADRWVCGGGSFQAVWGSTFWTQCWAFVCMQFLSMELHSSSCCTASSVLVSCNVYWLGWCSLACSTGTKPRGFKISHYAGFLWAHRFQEGTPFSFSLLTSLFQEPELCKDLLMERCDWMSRTHPVIASCDDEAGNEFHPGSHRYRNEWVVRSGSGKHRCTGGQQHEYRCCLFLKTTKDSYTTLMSR